MPSDPACLKSTAERRRQGTRRPVVYRLDVSETSGRDVGFLLDISTGGMKIRCYADVDVPALQKLRLIFPKWLGLGTHVDVVGRIAWRKPYGDSQVEGGFAFDGLSADAVAKLEELIMRLSEAAIEDGQL